MMWDCGYSQYTVTLMEQDDFLPRTIRLRLDSGTGMARDLVVVQCSNWPQQCSPLSTVFDLIKLVDEEQVRKLQSWSWTGMEAVRLPLSVVLCHSGISWT